MLRVLMVMGICWHPTTAVEIHAHSAGVFQIIDGRNKVPGSDLSRVVPVLKANDPERILLVFPHNYPVIGDADVPWSRNWYRQELARLAAAPDGWALKSVIIRDEPAP